MQIFEVISYTRNINRIIRYVMRFLKIIYNNNITDICERITETCTTGRRTLFMLETS